MKDAGWVGKGANGWNARDPIPPSTTQAPQAMEAPAPSVVLYDSAGRPLTRPRLVGFVPRKP
jgi:hypothetical protein